MLSKGHLRKLQKQANSACSAFRERISQICGRNVIVSVDVEGVMDEMEEEGVPETLYGEVWELLAVEGPRALDDLLTALSSISAPYQIALKADLKRVEVGVEATQTDLHPTWDADSGTLDILIRLNRKTGHLSVPVDCVSSLAHEPSFSTTRFQHGVVSLLEASLSCWGAPMCLRVNYASFDEDDDHGAAGLRMTMRDDGKNTLAVICEAMISIWKNETDPRVMHLFESYPAVIMYEHVPGKDLSKKSCRVVDDSIVFSVPHGCGKAALFDLEETMISLITCAVESRVMKTGDTTWRRLLLPVYAKQRKVYDRCDISDVESILERPECRWPILPIDEEAISLCKERVEPGERFICAWHIAKINRKGMEQERMLMLTNVSLTTIAYDFHTKKVDRKGGKHHELSLFLCADVGKLVDPLIISGGSSRRRPSLTHSVACALYFLEQKTIVKSMKKKKKQKAQPPPVDADAEELEQFLAQQSASHEGGEVMVHKDDGHSTETEIAGQKDEDLVDEVNDVPTGSDMWEVRKRKLEERPRPRQRFHPPVEDVYQNIIIPWWEDGTEQECLDFLREVCWTVYAVAAAVQRQKGYPPFVLRDIVKPKGTAGAKLYNAAKKGYSTPKVIRRVSVSHRVQEQGVEEPREEPQAPGEEEDVA